MATEGESKLNLPFYDRETGNYYRSEEFMLKAKSKVPLIGGMKESGTQAMDALIKLQRTGGIDFTPARMDLQTKTDSSPAAQNDKGMTSQEGIKFHLNPAELVQLGNAQGFVPVIIDFQPLAAGQAGMADLKAFLNT